MRTLLGALVGFCCWVLGTAKALAEPPAVAELTHAAAPSGDATLTLGARGERGDVRSELAGFVSVEFPFERLAAAGTRVAALDSAPGDAAAAGQDDAAEPRGDDAEPDGSVAPALGVEILARLARDTVAAAANASGAGARERDLDGIASRARASALLPELRVRVARSRDESLRLAPTTEDPYRFTLAGGNGTVVEGQATFRLNRLLFADEELPVERLRIERERGSERRQARVTARVLAWHRAVSRELGAADAEERGRAALRRVEAEVELDVLTDGWFSGRVARLRLGARPVERRDPAPPSPAAPKPASKTFRSERGGALVRLDAPAVSATSAESCLPTLATGSKTF